ncbi:hypothetical protein JMM81_00785 [Bacillus sp. V3B]|uniref:FapA family protein n=1 Tax=Bacillus sp. V3B TaxID=2804915 RepID=UPI00210B7FE8|nr:FapA family protein [Bacillus sp. V3B]MCQ6273509.1 hypothetical protein [Bacillus sp. V3B]
MKKIIKDNRGYALVTVLLIITIFMMLALSFIGQSANSIKQNKMVEKNSQSVALAEMGITYYQHAIENAYSDVKKNITELIEGDINNNQVKPEGYLETAKSNFITAIENIAKKKYPTDDPLHTFFQIENLDIDTSGENGNIQIKFSSVGGKNQEKTKLSAIMDFTLTKVTLNQEEEEESGDNLLPDFNEVKQLENICNYPQNDYSDCKTIVLDGTTPLDLGNGNNHNNMNTQIIYSTGALEFDGNNVNNMDNMKVHAEGKIDIHQNMQNVTSSIIETKGAIDIGNHLDLEGSRLLVGGDLTIGQHLTLTSHSNKGSFVYIEGNATIDNQLTINNNSTMCVGGILKIGNTVQTYELGLPNGIYTKDHPDFNDTCGSVASTILELDWGEMSPPIIINYEY